MGVGGFNIYFVPTPYGPEFIPALKTRGIAPGDVNNAISHVFVNTECSGKPDKILIFEVPPISQIIPAKRAPLQNPA